MLTSYMNPLNMSSISDVMPYDADMKTRLRFGEWLGDQIQSSGLGQHEVAAALGYAPSAVSNWLGGGNLPLRRVLPDIARVLQIDLSELTERYEGEKQLRGETSAPKGVRPAVERIEIPLLARVPASRLTWINAESERRMIELPASWLTDVRAPAMAVEVNGNCLAARGIYDGDIVICETVTDTNALPQGRVVLVRIEDEYTLKVWYWIGDDRAELRDGAGVVIATLSAGVDFEVKGIARKRFGNVL